MRELLRTNDLVLLSYAIHLLDEADIPSMVLDNHASAIEGSIGALPRRLVVEADNFEAAKREMSNASITISA